MNTDKELTKDTHLAIPAKPMTHEENLFYAGTVAGHLHMAGVRLKPKVDEKGNYTGEIDVQLNDDLHVLIRVTGAYQKVVRNP